MYTIGLVSLTAHRASSVSGLVEESVVSVSFFFVAKSSASLSDLRCVGYVPFVFSTATETPHVGSFLNEVRPSWKRFHVRTFLSIEKGKKLVETP